MCQELCKNPISYGHLKFGYVRLGSTYPLILEDDDDWLGRIFLDGILSVLKRKPKFGWEQLASRFTAIWIQALWIPTQNHTQTRVRIKSV